MSFQFQIHSLLQDEADYLLGVRVKVYLPVGTRVADVPHAEFDPELCRYLRYRTQVVPGTVDIERLPDPVQVHLRTKIVQWIDRNLPGGLGAPEPVEPRRPVLA